MEKYFNEIEKTTELSEAYHAGMGMSYKMATHKQEFFYRVFKDILSPIEIKIYVKIVNEVSRWVEKNKLSDHVYVEKVVEIGEDYIKLPHENHAYFRSIIQIQDKIEEIEEDHHEFDTVHHKNMQRYESIIKTIMPCYEKMNAETNNQKILKEVIRRSIIEPSDGTYYEEGKVIVFEPIIRKEDVLAWS
jgi:hypothetical protein